jgi:hypothetical protein
MKHGLLVLAAFAFGVISVEDSRYATWFTLLSGILLGLVYFVLLRVHWPRRIAPWLFACAALGKVAGNLRFRVQFGRVGPLTDWSVWGFAAVSLGLFVLERWPRKIHDGPSKSPTPLSS